MTTPCKYVCDNKTSEGYCKTTGRINPNYSRLQCARVPLDPLDQKDDMGTDKKGKMKTFNLIVSYSGNAKNWDEIKIDAENEKIKHVFIGKKEFVNVVCCLECQHWWMPYGTENTLGVCQLMDVNTTDDFFCKSGERSKV